MFFIKTFPLVLFTYLLLCTPIYAQPYYYDDSYHEQYDDGYYYSNSDYYYEEPDRPKKSTKHKKAKKYEWSEEQSTYDNSYYSRLPEQISEGEKVILVDPKAHAWGAYDSSGTLIRAGLATAGSKWCEDLGRPCKTTAGVFRINSLGSIDCYSSKYPLGTGGAPMPYCMYFNGNQGLHGSDHVVEGNISHGCVRLTVEDAEWLRFSFSEIGTKVVILPY